MILEILSQLLQKNLNRVISLNLHKSADKLLQFLLLANENKDNEKTQLDINELTESEYREWYENIFQLKYLQDLLNEKLIEIIIHQPNDVQVFYLNQSTKRSEININQFDLNLSLDIFATIKKKQFSFEIPFCSFQSNFNGIDCRLSIAHQSINKTNCHKLYCRKVANHILPLSIFQNHPSTGSVIEKLVEKKYNVLISGATASGKTSLIRTILSQIKEQEHLVIIEDTKELDIREKNTTHLLSREGQTNDIKNFCHHLLRMRPDRIILGEIRSEEVIPLLLNLNCGHKGLFATIHANSAIDTIERIATLIAIYGRELNITYTQTISLICQNIDFIVHMKDGKISEIINILGNQEQKVHYDTIY